MKALVIFPTLIFGLAFATTVQAGCLSGAALGAAAGHVAGHHAVIGAAIGCTVGHHRSAEQQRNQTNQTQSK